VLHAPSSSLLPDIPALVLKIFLLETNGNAAPNHLLRVLPSSTMSRVDYFKAPSATAWPPPRPGSAIAPFCSKPLATNVYGNCASWNALHTDEETRVRGDRDYCDSSAISADSPACPPFRYDLSHLDPARMNRPSTPAPHAITPNLLDVLVSFPRPNKICTYSDRHAERRFFFHPSG